VRGERRHVRPKKEGAIEEAGRAWVIKAIQADSLSLTHTLSHSLGREFFTQIAGASSPPRFSWIYVGYYSVYCVRSIVSRVLGEGFLLYGSALAISFNEDALIISCPGSFCLVIQFFLFIQFLRPVISANFLPLLRFYVLGALRGHLMKLPTSPNTIRAFY
jgi:hypothetical protein